MSPMIWHLLIQLWILYYKETIKSTLENTILHVNVNNNAHYRRKISYLIHVVFLDFKDSNPSIPIPNNWSNFFDSIYLNQFSISLYVTSFFIMSLWYFLLKNSRVGGRSNSGSLKVESNKWETYKHISTC